MSSDDIAIRVSNVAKRYELYPAPHDRLKQFVIPRMRRALRLAPRNYFQEFWALRGISFVVRKGETVGIVGRNGSGKSTLLQIICGNLNPTSGSINTNGRVAALLELGSGFNPEFTGKENVYLNGMILGLSKIEIDDRYGDIAAFADIGEFIDQPVKTYSSGMQVRLAFAVQAMVDPDILVVDEALAVGDEKFQRKCFSRLDQLKSRGTSILFVSHSAPQVIELCDRALLLERGERLLFSTPHLVTRAYQKMIYAPDKEQGRYIEEYRAIDGSVNTGADQLTHLLSAAASDSAPSDKEVIQAPLISESAYFDSSLVPETTTVYPLQGAEIESVRILSATGKLVNVLQPGDELRFVVSGKFLSDMHAVHFGIHIRTISGIVVTGQRYPGDAEHLGTVFQEKHFEVTFGFKMNLLPGTYFVGAGVWSGQGEHCAHRILDALMFRICHGYRSISFGYMDASCREPSIELR